VETTDGRRVGKVLVTRQLEGDPRPPDDAAATEPAGSGGRKTDRRGSGKR
jgi:hypothetical protein